MVPAHPWAFFTAQAMPTGICSHLHQMRVSPIWDPRKHSIAWCNDSYSYISQSMELYAGIFLVAVKGYMKLQQRKLVLLFPANRQCSRVISHRCGRFDPWRIERIWGMVRLLLLRASTVFGYYAFDRECKSAILWFDLNFVLFSRAYLQEIGSPLKARCRW